jgi:hypothetical protein
MILPTLSESRSDHRLIFNVLISRVGYQFFHSRKYFAEIGIRFGGVILQLHNLLFFGLAVKNHVNSCWRIRFLNHHSTVTIFNPDGIARLKHEITSRHQTVKIAVDVFHFSNQRIAAINLA